MLAAELSGPLGQVLPFSYNSRGGNIEQHQSVSSRRVLQQEQALTARSRYDSLRCRRNKLRHATGRLQL